MKKEFYAEHGTDKFLRESFYPDYDFKGVIVEVGAASPEFISTTKHFKDNGWRAIHIEPNPKFVKQHKIIGNEVYQYACSNQDIDNSDFTIVTVSKSNEQNDKTVTDHSYSSIYVKEEYENLDKSFFNSLNKEIIKVNIRKLDTIFKEIDIKTIDILSIDTEGWEIEVMEGLTLIKPKIVVLENLLHKDEYTQYMQNIGYSLKLKVEHNYIYELI